MHETHIIPNILRYLENQERRCSKKIKKMFLSIAEFGSLSEAHFREHYRQQAKGTRWETLEIDISRVPIGPELQITRIEFE